MTWGLVIEESLLQNPVSKKKKSPYAVRWGKHKRRKMKVSWNREEKVRAVFSEKEMRILAMRMSSPCVCACVCACVCVCIGCLWCCRKKDTTQKGVPASMEYWQLPDQAERLEGALDWMTMSPFRFCKTIPNGDVQCSQVESLGGNESETSGNGLVCS